ncbi:MAG: T9SS type A sorting domain-containing protein [Candidatus Azobacteroides sp.]|nr:T9SS type A sorting domain-containing protein [Candidatus Azobacteroides sp.]
MKKLFILSLLIATLVFASYAGAGTQNDPFTIAQAIAHKTGENVRYWVKGYVVGELNEYSNNKYFYELAPPFGTGSGAAYLLADNVNEIDLSKCLPIQLGSYFGDFNLDDNPQYWRKEILVFGFFRNYFAKPGLKDLTELQVLTPEPLKNEVDSWNFYEDFDEKKSYEQRDPDKTFAGGIYTGYQHTWNFAGATMGEDAKDQKWDRSSARIRLTEGPTGNSGYIEMMEDKPDGIGVIRFWAGYYDTDNNSYLKLSVSSDQGNSWQQVVAPSFIAKAWKEYQFTINKTGNIRLKIEKGDTSPSGINVDKIRMSDYVVSSPSSAKKLENQNDFSFCVLDNCIEISLSKPKNRISLFNITGQIVFDGTFREGVFRLPVSQGIYILRINNNFSKFALP